ncbi:hypothetical protein ACH5RR_029050 [Cinchona calisaya]|uniref:Uncharacterized protein n=1 Tax=Cinchona calisaya TaxID=153742 RepID=A0ABD2YU08_9GENT
MDAKKRICQASVETSIMKGCFFLEKMAPNSTFSGSDHISPPPICISGDTSRFLYTFRNDPWSNIHVARLVSEIVAFNYTNVRWFVFGDDHTVFFPENLVKTLSKYDDSLWYYIGTNSENFQQNKEFSFDMAFGGAGFAISYPLANVLAKHLDSCLGRYPNLYGSDGRIHACLAELGVTLTHESSFPQLLAPRRQCCDVLPSSADKVMKIGIRECGADELIYMHP